MSRCVLSCLVLAELSFCRQTIDPKFSKQRNPGACLLGVSIWSSYAATCTRMQAYAIICRLLQATCSRPASLGGFSRFVSADRSASATQSPRRRQPNINIKSKQKMLTNEQDENTSKIQSIFMNLLIAIASFSCRLFHLDFFSSNVSFIPVCSSNFDPNCGFSLSGSAALTLFSFFMEEGFLRCTFPNHISISMARNKCPFYFFFSSVLFTIQLVHLNVSPQVIVFNSFILVSFAFNNIYFSLSISFHDCFRHPVQELLIAIMS